MLEPYFLPHRIVMAPLIRSRARQPGKLPPPLNAAYYVQRASAALIISEATHVSMQGQGYAWTSGIHSREQIEGWHLITAAVHAARELIFLQMWHVGRISHPALQPDRMLPVAPRMLAMIHRTFRGKLILAGGCDHGSANEWLSPGKADLIAFGRGFLSTPDLPERFRQYAALNTPDPSTFYGGTAKGYTDYPTLAQTRGDAPKPCVDESRR